MRATRFFCIVKAPFVEGKPCTELSGMGQGLLELLFRQPLIEDFHPYHLIGLTIQFDWIEQT